MVSPIPYRGIICFNNVLTYPHWYSLVHVNRKKPVVMTVSWSLAWCDGFMFLLR